jgi:hypothetical protein
VIYLLLIILTLLVGWLIYDGVRYYANMLELFFPEDVEYMTPETVHNEWKKLSFNGKNPFRVIALASTMHPEYGHYGSARHMTSAYYSQIKHLLKKGQFVSAAAFYQASQKWAAFAYLRRSQALPVDKKKPIDLEVLGAPHFLMGHFPVLGTAKHRERALEFLRAAEEELNIELAGSPTSEGSSAIQKALIWSKLYFMTKDEQYLGKVRGAGLTRDPDEVGQLKRIASHLGFHTLDVFYQWCEI